MGTGSSSTTSRSASTPGGNVGRPRALSGLWLVGTSSAGGVKTVATDSLAGVALSTTSRSTMTAGRSDKSGCTTVCASLGPDSEEDELGQIGGARIDELEDWSEWSIEVEEFENVWTDR